MRWPALVALLLVLSCGRRNFNLDAGDEADAAPTPCVAPANCTTPRVVECGGQCIVSCDDSVSKAAAAVVCTTWGGCLATIRDQMDNDCVASVVRGNAIIGATQPNSASLTNEGWMWCDRSPLGYTNWISGEPDDLDEVETSDQQCVHLDQATNWTDEDCGDNLKFVCSRPL